MAQQPYSGLGGLIVRLHDHTQTHHTLGRTPLDEGSARRRFTDVLEDLVVSIFKVEQAGDTIPPNVC